MKAMICYITWNRLEYTKKSLASILKNTDRSKYDLLLWDNGSDIDSVNWITKFCYDNDFKFMFFSKNLGLTTAMNNQMLIASKMNNYDVFSHIANDIVVPENWLEGVFEALQSKKVGAVGLNLEFTNFEKTIVDGIELEKIHSDGNLCGAHFNIPRWIYELIGPFQHVVLGYGQQDANCSLEIRCIPKEFLPEQQVDVYYLPLEKYKGEDLGGTGKKYDNYQKQIEHRLRVSGSDVSGGRMYRSWVKLNYDYYLKKKITAEQMLQVLKKKTFISFDKSLLKEYNFGSKYL